MKLDAVYLEQMLESIQKVRTFIVGMSLEEFLKDQKTQSAVILQLVLIGELAKKVPAETKVKVSLPWKEIMGFRDRAIHDYYKIDLHIVWTTIAEDLQPLEDGLRKAL